MTDGLDLQWRAMREDDRNYVLSSWLLSYEKTSRRRRRWISDSEVDPGGEFQGMRYDVYCALYTPIVERLFARSVIAVAWATDLPDSILGWMAVEGTDTLHYFLTKPRFRKMGVAEWMTRGARSLPTVYTHEPPRGAGPRLLGAAWTYDPMRRFEKKAA